MVGALVTPYNLTLLGLGINLLGALLLAPGILDKAKRINDVYKTLRTKGVELSAAGVDSYLRGYSLEPPHLDSPEEELSKYRREFAPTFIGVSLLVLGFLLQILALLIRGPN